MTAIAWDHGSLEDKKMLTELEAAPWPIPVTRLSTTCCRAPMHWHGSSLVCTSAGTSDCGSGWSEGVLGEDSTEYEFPEDGLAVVAVREVSGVAQRVKFALSELCIKDIGSKHPILPWLMAYAAGQITRGYIGLDGQTPRQRQKGRVFPNRQANERTPGAMDRWIVPRGGGQELGFLRWSRSWCRTNPKSAMEAC